MSFSFIFLFKTKITKILSMLQRLFALSLPAVLLLLIDSYTYQAFKTATQQEWAHQLYWGITVLAYVVLAIIGVENWSANKRFRNYGDLTKAYRGAESTDFQLLLSHDPSHWRAEVLQKYPKIAATFLGHTHGFQFGINTRFYKWSPIKYAYKNWL